MPGERSTTAETPAVIQATSRQTRFDFHEETASKDLDLHTVHVSIGKRDILNDTHLKLSPGVHYVLVGRNGVGKSTLLRAIGERIIPGIPKTMRMLLLHQSYSDLSNGDETVLEYVVKSDMARSEALRRSDSTWFLTFHYHVH